MKAYFDVEIHAPLRLRITGMLNAVHRMDFSTLRDALGIADSVLSKHLSRLVEAGYVATSKATSGGRSRVWVELTPAGRRAFAAHVEALRQIAASQYDAAPPDASEPQT